MSPYILALPAFSISKESMTDRDPEAVYENGRKFGHSFVKTRLVNDSIGKIVMQFLVHHLC